MMLYDPNVDLVNDNVYKKIWLNSVHSFFRYGAKTKFLNQLRVVALSRICEKQRFTILMLILSMMMCIQNLVLFCLFVLKILSDQRTNGPVNAHLISWPSKAQNIQNLENLW